MPNPKLVQISTAMLLVPVTVRIEGMVGPARTEQQVMYQVNALDEDGHAWELVKNGPEDPGKWVALTRNFVLPALNGSNPRVESIDNKEARP